MLRWTQHDEQTWEYRAGLDMLDKPENTALDWTYWTKLNKPDKPEHTRLD